MRGTTEGSRAQGAAGFGDGPRAERRPAGYRGLVAGTTPGEILFFTALALVFVVPFLLILWNIRTLRRRNAAFLAAAPGVDVPLGAPATLRFVAAEPSVHALWLDLVMGGGADLVLDVHARVTCDGVELVRVDDLVRLDAEGDAQGLSRKGSGTVQMNTRYRAGLGGTHVSTVAKALIFTPPRGAAVVVEVACRPHPGTRVERCRAIVTPRPEP